MLLRWIARQVGQLAAAEIDGLRLARDHISLPHAISACPIAEEHGAADLRLTECWRTARVNIHGLTLLIKADRPCWQLLWLLFLWRLSRSWR
jgi:hypothetical protein